jgi:hypothetical protein
MWQLFVLVCVALLLAVSAVAVVRDWRESERMRQDPTHVPRNARR